jgi:hypothetical protein
MTTKRLEETLRTEEKIFAPSFPVPGRPSLAVLRHFFLVFAGGLSLLAAASRPASAGGLVCRQDCAKGPCSQVKCEPSRPGPGGSFCRCAAAAEVWGGTTYAAWCSAWGHAPDPTCVQPVGNAAPLPPQLPNAGAMLLALRGRNPYVATLVSALQDGPRWIEGPVEGLVHDILYDESRSVLDHNAALRFTGQAITGGLDSAQIEIAVTGDIRQLSHLKGHSDAATPSALPPRLVRGTVTAGGSHGSLQVTALDGRTETIQW